MTAQHDQSIDRDLDWDGCWNVRDFGGLRLVGGGATACGRLVRGDSPDQLTAAGWAALWDFGVRTVIDLRRADERASGVTRPPGVAVHHVSWDDYPGAAWNETHVPPGLPKSMRAFLRDYPAAVADTARLLIDAPEGAVLVHCAGGRDRTGLFTIVLGAVAGVEPGALYDDYRYSFARLAPAYRLRGMQAELEFLESDDHADARAQEFAAAKSVIDELDLAAAVRVLHAGGLADREVEALRRRLLGTAR